MQTILAWGSAAVVPFFGDAVALLTFGVTDFPVAAKRRPIKLINVPGFACRKLEIEVSAENDRNLKINEILVTRFNKYVISVL